MAKTVVPVTPAVLDWAIVESGFSRAELAASAGVDEKRLRRWIDDEEKPGLTELRKLAAKLHRQVAVFLLPAPPARREPVVRFRHPMGVKSGRPLTPDERRFLRRAERLQEAQGWLMAELEWESPELGLHSVEQDPERVAAIWRARLGVTLEAQRTSKSPSAAFDLWRGALEHVGIVVVQFPLGEDACRGFSLWDEHAPLVAVNTAWPDEARIFTLFHEVGHLLTRTNSACSTALATSHGGDTTERWCESFAGALLIPAEALADVTKVDDLTALSALARRLRVSLRATALRLIFSGKASWRLYERIPPAADRKRGGGGGSGRDRSEIRGDEFGARTSRLFAQAVQHEVISESQALDYLDIPLNAFEKLAASLSAR